ncbi:MAG: malonic semialdehyde reductase [Micrococcales bacterium]|nr:malonic semialdehyde reductase [Micrococcales bacterium]
MSVDTFVPTPRIDDTTANLLFRQARSVRSFGTGDVTDEQLRAAYDLAKWGPTQVNFTPLRTLVVRSTQARERLAAHLSEGNRQRVHAAPASLVLAADIAFHQFIPTLAPHMTSTADLLEEDVAQRERVATTNSWLQAGYLVVALRAVGLATGPMAIADPAGLDLDLLAGTGWRSFLVINVAQAAGSTTRFPRAARLTWEQTTLTR